MNFHNDSNNRIQGDSQARLVSQLDSIKNILNGINFPELEAFRASEQSRDLDEQYAIQNLVNAGSGTTMKFDRYTAPITA